MSRKLRVLNRILYDKLSEMRLFGKAEQTGPILHVSVEQIPGDPVDIEQLTEVLRAVVEASLIEGIRKVNVAVWLRGQLAEEPAWTTSFDYAPISVERVSHFSAETFRQDYPNIRVLFFVLAVAGSSLYLLQAGEWVSLLPSLLALVFGIFFPWSKRQINRWVAPLFRRLGLGAGLILLISSFYRVWLSWPELSVITLSLSLMGAFLMGLGL